MRPRAPSPSSLGLSRAHVADSLLDPSRSGTATSHGSIKRHNRLTEVLLHDLEFVATLASTFGGKTAKGKAYVYPKDELDSLWERALLCQFHDVLPGSAIGMVYEDVEQVRPSSPLPHLAAEAH